MIMSIDCLEPHKAVWPEIPSQHPSINLSHSTSCQTTRTVLHEPTFAWHQSAILFDVVQEQPDLEATRLYQATSVHSTHSDSDTLTCPSEAQVSTRKLSSSPTKSTPKAAGSHFMSATSHASVRSQRYQTASEYSRAFQSDGTMRLHDSPLHPHSHPYTNDAVRWQTGSPEEYDDSCHHTKVVEPKSHRVHIRTNQLTSSDALLAPLGSVNGTAQRKSRSQGWREPGVAKLVASGFGQKPNTRVPRSSSIGSRWTTESRWSPVDSPRLGYPSYTTYRHTTRAQRSNTVREGPTGFGKEHRFQKYQGENGRTSHSFGYKIFDRCGGPDRIPYPKPHFHLQTAEVTSNNSSGSHRQGVYYCFTCLADRVHRNNTCTYCKRTGLIPKLSQLTRPNPEEDPRMAEHAHLLRSAARGLSELSQHSSDDDGDELSYRGSLPSSTVPPYSPYDSQADGISSDSQPSSSSHHTYTMDSVGDVMKRLTELSKKDQSNVQMDSACSLSNSGSFASDQDKTNGPGTYQRPRLPTTLVRNHSPKLGKIVPIKSGGTTQSSLTNEEKSNDFLSETQKLVVQLEKRMLANDSPAVNGDAKFGNMEPYMTSEDHEVAEAFHNSATGRSTGINRRLLASLQRRNTELQSPEIGHRTESDSYPNGDIPRRQTNPTRRSGETTSSIRPKSQQPTSRLTLYNINPDQRERIPVSKRTGSASRMTRYMYPEVNLQPNTHRYNTSRTGISVRDGWDSNKHSQLATKSASIASPRLHQNVQDASKLSALSNWQRRKAYDPRTAIAQNGARTSSRTSAQSVYDDDQPHSSSTDEGRRTQQERSSKVNTKTRTTCRNKNIDRRTAPVETSDCINALEIINPSNGTRAFPARCSVVSSLLNPNRYTRPGTGYADAHSRLPVGRDRPLTETTDRKKRSPRSSSLNSATGEVGNIRESRTPTKAAGRKITTRAEQQLSTSNGRQHSVRCSSQMEQYVGQPNCPSRDLSVTTKDAEITTENQMFYNDQSYPDLGVESIRYKIEKLTNFIVRMRKRIERDYAEQGTCSPGDDMFGDEAVGATVAGQPTGMHPIVASSLKNLRVLEFNAQEIFSLLYPTEVDLWEPARACLAGAINDEKSFNDARSKLTEHIVNLLEDDANDASRSVGASQQEVCVTHTVLDSTNPTPVPIPEQITTPIEQLPIQSEETF